MWAFIFCSTYFNDIVNGANCQNKMQVLCFHLSTCAFNDIKLCKQLYFSYFSSLLNTEIITRLQYFTFLSFFYICKRLSTSSRNRQIRKVFVTFNFSQICILQKDNSYQLLKNASLVRLKLINFVIVATYLGNTE